MASMSYAWEMESPVAAIDDGKATAADAMAAGDEDEDDLMAKAAEPAPAPANSAATTTTNHRAWFMPRLRRSPLVGRHQSCQRPPRRRRRRRRRDS